MDPWQNIKNLSRSETLKLQDHKLQKFINNYLYPFSPHYKKIFDDHKINPQKIKCVADLKNIPFTSKRDFVDDEKSSGKFKEFVLQPDKEKIKKAWGPDKLAVLAFKKIFKGSQYVEHQLKKEFQPVFMTFTTGTTNQPVPFLYSNYDFDNLFLSGARMMQLFDVQKNETIVNLFPYAPHLAFWQVVCGGLSACTLTLSTGGGKVMGTEGNINFILKMKPSVILGVPSYVYHVFNVALEKKCDMSFVKKVVLGASRITKPFKKKLIELLEQMGAKDVCIFGTYGFTESRCAWAESPTHVDVSSGYHLYPDKEIFEVIDPKTGEVKAEGEDGELVYTSLDSRASSMLRYRTGDFVTGGIVYGKNEHSPYCVPRISSDISRLSDIKDLQLSKIKGSLVNFNNFAAALAEVDLVDEWQIELKKKNDDPFDMDELHIYICTKGHCDEEQLEEEIKKQMLISTEVTPNKIYFLKRSELIDRLQIETANKEKRILDNRPQH